MAPVRPRRLVTAAVLSLALLLPVGCAVAPSPGDGSGAPATPQASADAAPFALIQEPDAGIAPISSLIDGARHSIDVVIYALVEEHIVDDLIAAQKRGVQVRVILNRAFHGATTNAATYARLSAAGVAVSWAPASTVVHQKTIVVDAGGSEAVAAIGTGNLEEKYDATSRDAWIVDRDAAQVAAVRATFDADWSADQAGSDTLGAASTAPGLVWSPGATDAFTSVIESAHSTLEFASEELSSPAIIDALAAVAHRGVACSILMTDDASWHDAFAKLSAAGCEVRTLANQPSALYIHEKEIVVDHTAALVGSQNASTAALAKNRELSVELDAAAAAPVVSAMTKTFEVDWASASPWR